MDEDVRSCVRVLGYEVGRKGMERDESSVTRDRRTLAEVVRLFSEGGNRNASRLAGLPVVHEDVAHPVRVAWDEVRGVGTESHEAAVFRDGRSDAPPVALLSGRGQRGALGIPRHAVMD